MLFRSPPFRCACGVFTKALLIIALLLFQCGSSVAKVAGTEPETVWIGLKIDQIADINQKEENYTIVGTLQMRWKKARLAFEPGLGENEFRTYNLDQFLVILSDLNIRWPEISFYNQQGRLAIQNQIVCLNKDGHAQYFERFTATLQAPEFDFRRFPFDTQRFKVKIDSVFSDDEFVFLELPGFSGLGDKLGEEEWVVSNVSTKISTQQETTGLPASRFTLEFTAHRHLNYYAMRILIPSLLIVLVSWFSFFLRDFGKRVDLASSNLLLFIAFHFTISTDLPRLGYLTIMDVYLVGLFIITGATVLGNVILKRMEDTGRDSLAHRLDVYAIWAYPMSYAILIAGIGLFMA